MAQIKINSLAKYEFPGDFVLQEGEQLVDETSIPEVALPYLQAFRQAKCIFYSEAAAVKLSPKDPKDGSKPGEPEKG